MTATQRVNFSKNEQCPASADLLAFELGDLEIADGAEIRMHLAMCEFCAAEADFYARYPLTLDEEPTVAEKIPEPLFQLAEALLKHNADQTGLSTLLKR